ncbi:MAG: PepSY domain-containing protein [Candidatus Eremiobacteraeota bacterium]|nr:PepSY domain-containing protein [Candidatus Eremiobacteraeota bacterium]
MNLPRLAILALAVAYAGTGAAAVAAPTPKLIGQKLVPLAKVSPAQARAIALRTIHGTIVSQELEREPGGSGLRYTFDLKTAAGTREVGVDAKTGAVIENIHDKD